MRILLLLALSKVAPVLGKLGVVIDRLLAFREAALVNGLGGLLARREIAFLFLSLRVMLGRLLPGAKGALMPVLMLVRAGDAFRFLTLAHGGPPFSLALASSVAGSLRGPRSTPTMTPPRAPAED
jgi:hypothetical protein